MQEAQTIDAAKQIELFHKFLEEHHYADLVKQASKGHKFLVVELGELAKFNPELADLLLEDPEEVLAAASAAVDRFDLAGEVKNFQIRFKDLPESQQIMIRDIRSRHIGKFLEMQGIVKQKTDVRPQVTAARFECPSCGNIIAVLQLDTKFKEPTRCGCGRKGKFRLIGKELVDAQKITLEESPDELEGGEQPKRFNIFLKNDLVSPITEKRTNPGAKIKVVGIVKEVPITLQQGGQSTRFDLMCEANFVEPVLEDFSEMAISPEELAGIEDFAKRPDVYESLIGSLAPSIYGHDKIKEALLLQLFGGVRKSMTDGVVRRGDIHILLIGDPGSGKSQLLRRIAKVAPKSRFVSGKGASGAGLCVSPESMVLTNPGGCETIQEVVESRMEFPLEFRSGVWKRDNVTDVKIQSLSKDMKLHSKHPSAIWRLEAPEFMYEVTLDSGKRVQLTANTKLFVLNGGKPSWTKSSEITTGTFVGTPRKLIGGTVNEQSPVDLIASNPVVRGVEDLVKESVEILKEIYGSVRKAANALCINENQLYHHWVNPETRGTIKLNDLRLLAEAARIPWKHRVQTVSLWNGKKHKVPINLSKEFLHVAGLIAGDGDMRKTPGDSIAIRLSNGEPTILDTFRNLFEKEFQLSCDTQPESDTRPQASRVASKIVGEILMSLGISLSPKSSSIFMSNTLLHLSNKLLASYIAGLYDADGSVYVSKGHNSSCIEFTTCSEKLARQLQLAFLRYGVHARLRPRSPSVNSKIQGKLDKWVLSIRGKDIETFAKEIPLRHPKKKAKLALISKTKHNTNIDVVPGVSERLKEILQSRKIPLKKAGWHPNLSKEALQRIVLENQIEDVELLALANSDVFWEKVKSVELKKSKFDFVYDLTVEDSHNFIVDGVLVHNTASVVKDDFLRGWALEAGALPLTNKGICCIDELDKMTKEDTSALHEALEQQTISISKANIQATLRAETTVLAAANPKFGRFDPYEMVGKQIELPSTLINRFDLIFAVKDMPDKFKDEQMASFILDLHQDEHALDTVELKTEFYKKYVSYARIRCKPILSDEAKEEIQRYFVEMRASGGGEGGVKAVPISARQLEALVRLSEASAKTRLDTVIRRKDSRRAIELVHYCLQQIGMDPQTGKIDIDRFTGGIPASERNQIHQIKEIINQLTETYGKVIETEDVIQEALNQSINQDKAEEILEKLTRKGDIYHPKPGKISKM
ncbi:MAG: LAGLIDADG family homing endonuclease [Candidatus Woesearchaeota archaeon]